ncbi:MAG: D-alanyl-D-alanine carboxypeptidase/D-alanyl-D-alanine-endopeptidase [Vicinamibacteria bacterium]
MKRLPTSVVCFVLASAAFADTKPAAKPAAKTSDRLAATIETILKRDVFTPALVAIDIRDLDTGRVLYELNAAKNVKPASTMKLFTTAAILDAEGPGSDRSTHHAAVAEVMDSEGLEWRPTATTVETVGRIDSSGRILGDVYLVGRGDPNLSDRIAWRNGKNPFDQLAVDLQAQGVTRIEGRLLGQDALFPDASIPDGWTVDDLVWSYGAEVSALSAFDSQVDLSLEPGDLEGDPGRLTQWPETTFLRIENRTVTAPQGTEQDLTLTRALGSRTIVLEGRIPRAGKKWAEGVATPEPALFATTLFAEALQRHGISIADSVAVSRAALPKEVRPIASIRGPAIEDQIRFTNKESQNLHAETLLRRLGLAVNGDASMASSLRAREAFLKAHDIRIADNVMHDGSGLSRGDLVTVRSLVDLLAFMAKHRLAKPFRDSLPIAGVDGTLRRRMIGTKAEGHVFAKTGSLSNVNALAGYIDTTGGRHLAFSIIVNNHTRPSREATQAVDEICALLADLR